MAKREFLQLAHKRQNKHGVAGLWWSEKIDGRRAFWDGGISRGFAKSEIPWANLLKDERYVKEQYATGLWSRYGNVIHAPEWWLDALPKIPLDGELWNGLRIQGNRQRILSITQKIEPIDWEWKNIKLMAIESPPLEVLFSDGLIDTINYKKVFKDIPEWIAKQHFQYDRIIPPEMIFRSNYYILNQYLPNNPSAIVIKQSQLDFSTSIAEAQLEAINTHITKQGGEGVIIRNPDRFWESARSHNILKVKKYDDAEAKVIGYVTGRETDKGSKLLGLMGAMIVEWNGKQFELSGFTDTERRLITKGRIPDKSQFEMIDIAEDWARKNPETKCPEWIEALQFPRGTIVTFKYRGLTGDGIPNEASYWREA